ncbi:unnamed protein product [Wuchereria bancrofti]|uniref:Uncharacterized protein n=1 Tax=Wuchereria bancrofti TaxID=6293 RepID=A0A3P7DVS9_WUCBA|nr:unnamed protein product [Wuchereria bancrofti]
MDRQIDGSNDRKIEGQRHEQRERRMNRQTESGIDHERSTKANVADDVSRSTLHLTDRCMVRDMLINEK